ncbi:ABC transporter D family protein [Heterostelium album PN500]|uniref:ABC transporter D family protein n=1 Tax=Heterostelium pallidum (strain ATCC 26659 / Pp 5 / PN500) TaxID=670386 RepID=D3BCI5_HETP5|nr:ABC transporter D family protein [Heterostelium album PN500]EFA80627.1 ABC transporter D family protein [Heterostelium album PN500]|eukprot:XP_020432747.1 ABC transporter D family protein [Heterostelium album PN500]
MVLQTLTASMTGANTNRTVKRAQQKLLSLLGSLGPTSGSLTKKLMILAALGGGAYTLIKFYKTQKDSKSQSGLVVQNKERSGDRKSTRVTVDAVFFKRLAKIIRIIIPSIRSKEFLSLMFLTVLLLARTMLSVSIAEIAGRNAQNLVARKWKEMRNGVLKFALISIPASFVNSTLKYETDMLALRFRKRLSEYVHREYLEGVNFYKASHLGGNNRIDNADQRVTSDIEMFCNSMSNLYTTVFKPVLDLILFTSKLVGVMGWGSPLLMFGYFIISGSLKKLIMPPFGKLTAKQSELEGNYRTVHQRLITNAEEIAFYDGARKERQIINLSFGDIYRHTGYVSYLRCLVGIFDGFLVKYCASIVGYGCMALPIYLGIKGTAGKDSTELTKDYIRNTQLMMALAQAIGQLVLLGNKITNMAGYTSRVSELLEMIKSLKERGSSTFVIVEDDDISSPAIQSSSGTSDQYLTNDSNWLVEWKKRSDNLRQLKRSLSQTVTMQSVTGGGSFVEGEFIKFSNVSIVSPEGKLLVTDLNFEVKPQQNVMITGPNGSGKSSLFRILGELWPLHCGTVIKPRKEDILFVPQKPYLVLGTLRDQIIYPHNAEDMKKFGITDDDLVHLLSTVDPNNTIINQWAWDDVKDWFTALSGGQKQRIAMARLFYHRPQYAILDECTSAVSDEVEGKIYETCKTLGITLFTVSHRQQLRAYHDDQLLFDGRGGWEWTKIDHSQDHINKPLSYK